MGQCGIGGLRPGHGNSKRYANLNKQGEVQRHGPQPRQACGPTRSGTPAQVCLSSCKVVPCGGDKGKGQMCTVVCCRCNRAVQTVPLFPALQEDDVNLQVYEARHTVSA